MHIFLEQNSSKIKNMLCYHSWIARSMNPNSRNWYHGWFGCRGLRHVRVGNEAVSGYRRMKGSANVRGQLEVNISPMSMIRLFLGICLLRLTDTISGMLCWQSRSRFKDKGGLGSFYKIRQCSSHFPLSLLRQNFRGKCCLSLRGGFDDDREDPYQRGNLEAR